MDLFSGYLLYWIIGIIVLYTIFSVRQVNQYQRGVMFTLGKYTGMKNPGLRLSFLWIQNMIKVDLRTKVVDVPDQEAITKDNVSIRISAVIYYKINDAAKSVIEVENFYFAVSQLAQTTMRNAVGEVDLDELLKNRDDVAASIKVIVDKASEPWGILVEGLELKDIGLPADMKRTMAKAAEAEREKKAVVINSEGELAAAMNVAKAAKMLSDSPGALHLRTLQSINDMSSDQSNTVVWMVPTEALKALEGIAKMSAKK